MRFRVDFTIDAGVSEVFSFLSNPEKQKQWIEDLETTEILSGSLENPVGMRFRQRMRGGRVFTGEVMAYREPHELRVRLNGSGTDLDVRYQLIEIAGRTRLSYCADVLLPTLGARILAVLLYPYSRASLKKSIGKLKTVCEREPT